MIDWATEKYVSLRTFKRDGTPVDTAVWIAPLGDGRIGFTTDPGSWKVKRVRHTPGVELRACSMRGAVAPGAAVVRGEARIVTEADPYREVVAALRHKYGLQVTLVELGGMVKQFLKRNRDHECALVITVPDH